MKTQIRISGQVAGNQRLHLHLQSEAEKVERSFNDFLLTFRTKEEAVTALRTAYDNLVDLEPEFHADGGIYLLNDASLYYDASSAKII